MGSPAQWIAFLAVVLGILALDQGVFHKRGTMVGLREALVWSAVWIVISLSLAGFIYARFGTARALEFTTGYLIEKALSVDNLFVFAMVFGALDVPARFQRRVLAWGIVGALGMRAVFIVVGAAALHRVHWVLYPFGGILLYSGFKQLVAPSRTSPASSSPFLPTLRRWLPASNDYDDDRFVTRRRGRLLATPLLVALVTIEVTDIVFAVDSIPAVLAITENPFIVFTSNICALLGLRSLYFVIAGALLKFERLHVGLALVLMFVGAKILLSRVYAIPLAVCLAVIACLVGGSMVWSVKESVKARELRPSVKTHDARRARSSPRAASPRPVSSRAH
jgi:tellurite resistance protein TerC